MILFRAVSTDEYKDFKIHGNFRTAKNTLEAKQFFKREKAVLEFVNVAVKRSYRPPYKYVLIIDVDNQCLEAVEFQSQNLDGHDAITIQEDDFPSFNNCITFIEEKHV
jgi:hypothetical protein